MEAAVVCTATELAEEETEASPVAPDVGADELLTCTATEDEAGAVDIRAEVVEDGFPTSGTSVCLPDSGFVLSLQEAPALSKWPVPR